MLKNIQKWYSKGTPWLWLSAAAIGFCLVIVFGIVGFIASQAIPHFWPSEIKTIEVKNKNNTISKYYGELYDTEVVKIEKKEIARSLFKISNNNFIWVDNEFINKITHEDEAIIFERREKGFLYAKLISLQELGQKVINDDIWGELQLRIERAEELHDEIEDIQKSDIGSINYKLEQIRLNERYLELNGRFTDEKRKEAEQERKELNQEYNKLAIKLNKIREELKRDSITVKSYTANGEEELIVPLENIVRGYRTNQLGVFGKISVYFDRLGEYLFGEPREANTEGGVFPAIFGTVMMVIIMTIFVTPFGILAAIYLREYSKQGVITRFIRIAVVNLAGVPSIVYGVFGFGFLIYVLGEHIDELFYPEALPSPTFGTPGILWSAITLALLTLPVVIVTTEEGLSRIPRALREGSLALGATKSETLWKVIIPISTPSMITGLILAIARAAGEVAPLMLVGVVKMAPTLPLDGNFPYLHMDRKFMHLGFHIYDVGFQSPNVEAARPLVFATAFLLIVVIILLNLFAIVIRNRLREKYKSITG